MTPYTQYKNITYSYIVSPNRRFWFTPDQPSGVLEQRSKAIEVKGNVIIGPWKR